MLSTPPPPLSIPAGVPELLRDLIHERIGQFFESSRLDILMEKLQELPRTLKCHSFLDYYYILKYDNNAHGEWSRVMDALSVQETYFWREMSQIHLVADVLVPAWFRQSSSPLRIWSAACATGEEPYTLLMALIEAGFENKPIEIAASDASEAALRKARDGIYRERSFRSLPPHLREKYFTPVAGGFQFNPNLARRITFHQANIVSNVEIAHLGRAPIIFCRNVFIYFSPDTIRRTLKNFVELMPPKGNLFVGASESLLNLTQDLVLEEMGDAFVYVKQPAVPAIALPVL